LFFAFSGLFLQTELFEEEWYESIESVILAATGIFSLLLLALSILAYRRTGLKKIIFAAIAFSLCDPTNPGVFRGKLWHFGRTSSWRYFIIFINTCHFSFVLPSNSKKE